MRVLLMLCCGTVTVVSMLEAGAAADARDDARVPRAPHVQARFTGCTEFAGLTPVPIERVRTRVPTSYSVAGETDGVGIVVVRVASCRGIGVKSRPATPGVVAQIGVNVVPPTGAGDINNYTLYLATNSAPLFAALRAGGLTPLWVPEIAYAYTPNPAATGGSLFVDVPRPRRAAYELGGELSEPLAGDPGFPFVANWWLAAPTGDIVAETVIPNIRFGDASGVSITVDPGSELAAILGAVSASFPVLSVRGVFDEATLEIRNVPL
jgi:hypothetical protein